MKERQILYNKVLNEFTKLQNEGKLTNDMRKSYNKKLLNIALTGKIENTIDNKFSPSVECFKRKTFLTIP